jgi:phage terminase small subunit
MTKLSEQQERFCQFVIQGFTQTEAYKRAGYKSKDEHAAGANASRLIANDRIAQRIAELRAPVAKRAEVTLAYLQKRALRLLNKAEKAQQFAAANGALKELGILSGERVERSERTNRNITVDEYSDEDLIAHLASNGSAGAIAEASRAKGSDPVH